MLKKIEDAKLPKTVYEEVMKEFFRLKKMKATGNAETSVISNFIEIVLDLPWNMTT